MQKFSFNFAIEKKNETKIEFPQGFSCVFGVILSAFCKIKQRRFGSFQQQ